MADQVGAMDGIYALEVSPHVYEAVRIRWTGAGYTLEHLNVDFHEYQAKAKADECGRAD